MNKTIKITTIALAAVLNIAGGQIALLFKLPIYLDVIGTLFTAAVLGPFYALVPGLISSIITGVTMDIYSLYFMPVQLVVGFVAGWVFRYNGMRKWRLPLGTALVTLPGTFVAAVISAFLFGGFTSSGSSLIVMFLRGLGMNDILSVFVVQFFTDYADRFITISLVLVMLTVLPGEMIHRIKGVANESLQ